MQPLDGDKPWGDAMIMNWTITLAAQCLKLLTSKHISDAPTPEIS